MSYKELFEKRLGVPKKRKLGNKDFYNDFFGYYGIARNKPITAPSIQASGDPVQDLSAAIMPTQQPTVAPPMIVATSTQIPVPPPPPPIPGAKVPAVPPKVPPPPPPQQMSPISKSIDAQKKKLQDGGMPSPRVVGKKTKMLEPGQEKNIRVDVPTDIFKNNDASLLPGNQALDEEEKNLTKMYLTSVDDYKQLFTESQYKDQDIYPIFVKNVSGKDRFVDWVDLSLKNVSRFLTNMAGEDKDITYLTPGGKSGKVKSSKLSTIPKNAATNIREQLKNASKTGEVPIVYLTNKATGEIVDQLAIYRKKVKPSEL